MPFPQNLETAKRYEITLLARKGADYSYELWLDSIDDYVPRVQRMLREHDWAANKYYGVKVTRLK